CISGGSSPYVSAMTERGCRFQPNNGRQVLPWRRRTLPRDADAASIDNMSLTRHGIPVAGADG
ncbi:MAG: hypothetical protein ABGY41_03680, partial [Candidatus Poribacteria bacterium]